MLGSVSWGHRVSMISDWARRFPSWEHIRSLAAIGADSSMWTSMPPLPAGTLGDIVRHVLQEVRLPILADRDLRARCLALHVHVQEGGAEAQVKQHRETASARTC